MGESVSVYIFRSIEKAIDFMVDRAWFDVVSLMAAVIMPASAQPEKAYQRVIFVVFFSVLLYSIREYLRGRQPPPARRTYPAEEQEGN
mgnify:CR=1 FL=1